jgi:hypothetical protein
MRVSGKPAFDHGRVTTLRPRAPRAGEALDRKKSPPTLRFAGLNPIQRELEETGITIACCNKAVRFILVIAGIHQTYIKQARHKRPALFQLKLFPSSASRTSSAAGSQKRASPPGCAAKRRIALTTSGRPAISAYSIGPPRCWGKP